MTEEPIPPKLKMFDEAEFYLEIETLVEGGGNYIDALLRILQ
jgi:hypothetical protein